MWDRAYGNKLYVLFFCLFEKSFWEKWLKNYWHFVTGEVDKGIVICGTGVGISLAANKVNGIRCVTCSEPYSALLSRQHNNTNMLAFGARVVGIELAKMIVDAWLSGEYEGGRHQVRIDMLKEIEEKQKNK